MKDLVEQYVNITRQLKNLEERQKELSEAIKSHGPGRYEGDSDYVAVQVSTVSGRKTTNWQGVCVLKRQYRTLLWLSTPRKGRTVCA